MKLYNFVTYLLTVKISAAKISPVENRNEYKFSIDIINELNQKLDIKWNAVVALQFTQEMNDVLKSLSLPVLLISKNSNTNIELLYRQRVLIIVFAQLSTINKVFDMVQNLSKQSQFSHYLWIIPDARITDLANLSDTDWFFGYTNVFYYTCDGLFSYHPVPSITTHHIENLEEYF